MTVVLAIDVELEKRVDKSMRVLIEGRRGLILIDRKIPRECGRGTLSVREFINTQIPGNIWHTYNKISV